MKKEIIKGNKLITSFLDRSDKFTDFDYINPDQSMYHNSWDWLMQAVKKLRDKYEWEWFYTTAFEGIRSALLDADIERVWQSAVELIELHNENKLNVL